MAVGKVEFMWVTSHVGGNGEFKGYQIISKTASSFGSPECRLIIFFLIHVDRMLSQYSCVMVHASGKQLPLAAADVQIPR